MEMVLTMMITEYMLMSQVLENDEECQLIGHSVQLCLLLMDINCGEKRKTAMY